MSPNTSPLYNSTGGGNIPSLIQLSQPAIPLITGDSCDSTEPTESFIDFGDGCKSIVDLDTLYAVETKTNVPDFKRIDKSLF